MADIKPFRGMLYNTEAVGDLSAVLAPPYDVISSEMRENLYLRSEFNSVRLILGKDFPGDDEHDNKYVRARRSMDEWISRGILFTDPEDCFYVYRQEYEVYGEPRSRTGFLGLMKVEGPDVVLPHEHTLSKPKEDRMNLIRQVESNLSPIFGLYSGDDKVITNILNGIVTDGEPVFDTSVDGVRNVLWRVSGNEEISRIRQSMQEKKIFIADGHHRYAVARAYRDLCRQEEGYDGRADHVMTYLADISSPENLTVLGTHRVLKDIPGLERQNVSERLGEYFTVTRMGGLDELVKEMRCREQKSCIYGLYNGKEFLLLEPAHEGVLKNLIQDKPLCWKDLDVSVLHSAVFEKVLSLEPKEGDIVYVKAPEDARRLVAEGKAKLAFLLNPTKIGQLRDVAESGEMMPQKSTYFYPKLLTGIVMNRFGDQKHKVG